MKHEKMMQEWYEKNNVDALYTSTNEQLQDPLFTKFTGIYHTDFSFRFFQSPEKKLLLCTPLERRVVKHQYNGRTKTVTTQKEITHVLRGLFGKKKIGLNLRYMTATQYTALKKTFPHTPFKDVSEALEKTRTIKTKEEKRKIIEAVKITQEISTKIPPLLRKGKKEIEIVAEINYHLAREGCGNAFPTIVAFGNNTPNIHHFPRNKKLVKNEIVLVDFGAKYQGYCTDATRTFCFGKASEEQKEWYARVWNAQQEAFKTIIPGKKAFDTMKQAEKILGRKIPHAVGHGIGLETHDYPGAIQGKADWEYQEGMTLAIEPGYYGKAFGIRIEDDVLVTKNGCKILSHASKKLVEI
ncbi:MAG: Xaa-Pro peptidase family protein [Candidatus Diapherotrites archaeon]